jgi:hypothetical protein
MESLGTTAKSNIDFIMGKRRNIRGKISKNPYYISKERALYDTRARFSSLVRQ